MQYLNRYKEVLRDGLTTIGFRFLEIKENGDWVIKKDKDHEEGYYDFLIDKTLLDSLIKAENPKNALYSYFAENIDQSFLEFLIFEMRLENLYIASIYVYDTDQEYSFLEAQYMENTFLRYGASTTYNEELGPLLSEFDSYPYHLYRDVMVLIDDDIRSAFNTINISKKSYDICRQSLVDGKTLQAIGDEYGITKEAVRQTLNNSIKKLAGTIDGFIVEVREKIATLGLYYAQTVPIEDKELKSFVLALISHEKTESKIFYDKDLDALYIDKANSYKEILSTIATSLTPNSSQLFTEEEMKEFLQKHLLNLQNIDRIFNKLFELGDIKELNGTYFFNFLYPKKREMIDFYFSQFPSGILIPENIGETVDGLNTFFPNVFDDKDRKRGIHTAVAASKNIVLWDRGLYIHKRFIQKIVNEVDLHEILEYIDSIMTDTGIELASCFEKHKEMLLKVGIPTKNALYTVLQLQYPDLYSYQKRPWIAKPGVKHHNLKTILLENMHEGKPYSLDELVSILQSPKVNVTQLIARTDEIIEIDKKFYKRDCKNG